MYRRDLQERTMKFGQELVGLCRSLRQDAVSRPLISQVVRSATSIGANYMEACAACSRKDFRHKIYLCRKESQETLYWFGILLTCFPEHKIKIDKLQKECKELVCIFQSATYTLDNSAPDNFKQS
jgi:four helix bundle protein